ncbi:hypothetical protein EUX98_g3700 [Antrodiella citrinella]|uniref:Uncharacterized protein n=1 Tax=Antrodiella citrinella TaxID=2447956 RepID=A0A4S4MXZ5_9APHY|nr:hypothetical protein EUX98_g3700 [Antrodiella citrinella]
MDALSSFLQAQRDLLAQTEGDIDALKELRCRISEHPRDLDVSYFLDEIKKGPSKLSEKSDITATIPDDFDWSLFGSQDPAPFKTISSSFAVSETLPRSHSSDDSSSLLQLVRDRRRTIIDPVLASMPPLSSDEEDEPIDPEELKKLREREKIRDLKLRKINGGGSFGTRKPRASKGVFIRTDVEDESAEVDIWGGVQAAETRMVVKREVEAPPSSVLGCTMDSKQLQTSVGPRDAATSLAPSIPVPVPSSSTRQRRPSRPVTTISSSSRPTRGKVKQSAPANVPDALASDVMDTVAGASSVPSSHDPSLNKKGKPRPETYKQAWSVSEQHLLERLLEEIPEGERNRWAQISKAMSGRRTPRQVASRVQKYYEKLKRFGLEMGKA